jgi:pimeloyl-ACP methyl ester carboxylesterase
MHTGPNRTITHHTASAVTAPKPSAASVVQHRIPLAADAISYTKAGTVPAVLLIHGLGGTRRTWEHLIPLSDPPAGDYSLGAHACALRDLLLTLGYPRANIVGHSLGGGVALQRRAVLRTARTVEGRRVAARSMSGHVSSFDGLVRH